MDEVVRALLQALKDSEWRVREAAASALGRMSEVIPEKQLTEVVRALLQDSQVTLNSMMCAKRRQCAWQRVSSNTKKAVDRSC